MGVGFGCCCGGGLGICSCGFPATQHWAGAAQINSCGFSDQVISPAGIDFVFGADPRGGATLYYGPNVGGGPYSAVTLSPYVWWAGPFPVYHTGGVFDPDGSGYSYLTWGPSTGHVPPCIAVMRTVYNYAGDDRTDGNGFTIPRWTTFFCTGHVSITLTSPNTCGGGSTPFSCTVEGINGTDSGAPTPIFVNLTGTHGIDDVVIP